MVEKKYINCERCGCLTELLHGRQRYCPECAAQKNKRFALNAKMMTCEGCGGWMEYRPHRKFCYTCAALRRQEQNAASRARQTALGLYESRKKPKIVEHKYVKPKRTGHLFDLTGKSLTEVALEARTLKLTYGAYSTACALGTIEAILASAGISRDAARRMIAAEKRRQTKTKKKIGA